MTYYDAEVPFHVEGDRRYLTGLELVANPVCKEFYEKYRQHFRHDYSRDIVWFEPRAEDRK